MVRPLITIWTGRDLSTVPGLISDSGPIVVYTDGACRGNPGRGGWAWAVPDGAYEIEFGSAAVVREGADVTVVALALMVHHCLKAGEVLDREGISIELIDPRTVAQAVQCDPAAAGFAIGLRQKTNARAVSDPGACVTIARQPP